MHNRIDILGVPVSVVDMRRAAEEISRCVTAREPRYVCAADVHSVMQAQRNAAHMDALRGAHMVLPDGTPLVWAARARGEQNMSRVCGPDIMLELCRQGVARGWRHVFYGGAPGVAEELARRLAARFPGLRVGATLSPPFRTLDAAETADMIAAINAARPDIVWVGLGCPKQESWMRTNAPALDGAVVIGVGAAFDFHAGRVRRAPAFMRQNGLEWLHRLVSEPRRLWRRYLVLGPQFMGRAFLELYRSRVSSAPRRAD